MHSIAHITFFGNCLVLVAVINMGRFGDAFYK